jgi:hypothetical protein
MSIARTKTFTLIAAAITLTMALAPSHALAASAPGVSIKQVRPASGDAAATTKPAAKVLALTDTSTPDVEPAMRDLIDRARALDNARADWRADKQLTEELCNLLARGGPDAQRLIFEYYRVFKERSAGIMLAALATHFEKNEVHPAACAAAGDATSHIITAAVRSEWNPNSSAHIVLSRMAQRPELMQHITDDMRRHGCDPMQIASVFKGGGSGDGTELALRMREWVVTSSLPMPTRVNAIHTLATIDGEQALEALIDIADGSDPGVDGAERAPQTNTRRTPVDIDNDNLRQLRESAMAALVNRRFNNRRDAKLASELERRLIPVFSKIATTTQQRSLLERAISSLSELGNDGKIALINQYEKETHGTRAQAMAEKIAGYTDYPRTLVLNSNHTGGGGKRDTFRTAAVRIMRLGMQNPQERRTELLRITSDAQADAELRRQATIAVLEKPGMRSTVATTEIQRLLGSPYPEVADAAMRLLARELDARMFSPETVRPLFNSPVRGQREIAIRQTFAPHLRGQLTPDVVLPLLQSEYLDVAQAVARALYADDALRRSVGIDSARRIGALTGIQTVDDITCPLTPRATWSTEIPRVSAAATSNVPSQAGSGDATSWLWNFTLWPAALLIAAVAIIYLFAMLTVPEPRIAITPPDA